MTISVIIPIYNEEDNIDLLYERLRPVLARWARAMKSSL